MSIKSKLPKGLEPLPLFTNYSVASYYTKEVYKWKLSRRRFTNPNRL